jgi:glycosyltransferase involved in cell wall biosynthesis
MLCEPAGASEAAVAWHWAKAYSSLGHDVTLFTDSSQRSFFTADHHAQISTVFIEANTRDVAKVPANPFQAIRLYFEVARWNRGLRLVKDELASFELVHQVSISTVRVPTPLKSVGPTLVWGPLGGGHSGITRGLTGLALLHEKIRNVSIGLSAMRYRVSRWFHDFDGSVLVTNEATKSFVAALGARNISVELSDGLSPLWLQRLERQCSEARRPMWPVFTPEQGSIRILWAGRLVESKRPDLAISVAKELADRGISVELNICGDGPARGTLHSLVESSAEHCRVKFAGRLSRQEMAEAIALTDICLFTSFRDSSSPFLLEGLAARKFCVAVRGDSVGACFPDQLVPGPDPGTDDDLLVDAIVDTILSGPRCGPEECLEFARTHVWEDKATRVVEACRQRPLR